MFYIYTITNKVDRKVYVGVTKNPIVRWRTHRSYGAKPQVELRCKRLYDAMYSVGRDNFVFEVVAQDEDRSRALELETMWIRRLGAIDPVRGYNIREVNSGYQISSETKQKLREARLRQPCPRTGKTHGPAAKAKMRAARLGKTPWNKGRPWTEAERKKLSDSHANVRGDRNPMSRANIEIRKKVQA